VLRNEEEEKEKGWGRSKGVQNRLTENQLIGVSVQKNL